MCVLIALGIYLLVGFFFSGLLTDWWSINVDRAWLSIISMLWPIFAAVIVGLYVQELQRRWVKFFDQ